MILNYVNSLFHLQKKAQAAQARLAKLGLPLPGGKVSIQLRAKLVKLL